MQIIKIMIIASFSAICLQGCASIGELPGGERLERIKKSENYKDGAFRNPEDAPRPAGGIGFGVFGSIKRIMFDRDSRSAPSKTLPSKKTDLKMLNPEENVLIWMGHSSYYLQVDGKKILIDPVLSGSAFVLSSFDGTDIYTPEELPAVDYLIVTHDHWDHLDYKTVTSINKKVRRVFTGLGTGAHLESWNYDEKKISEFDWNESLKPEKGFTVTAVRSRHFSGRFRTRNQSLWVSFVLETPKRKIFICGDSGYGDHFKDIGKKFGPFDLAILECGQYNVQWKNSHMFPEQTAQATIDLNAKKLFAGHWGKFVISTHAWDEPIRRLVEETEKRNIFLLHPMIGEKVNLDADQVFPRWWEGLE